MSQQHHFDEHYEHEGRSDATPGGYSEQRRPGETAFALFLVLFSLFALWDAYGISGLSSLSGAGIVPMATTATMALTAGIVLRHTLSRPMVAEETLRRDILPASVLVFIALLVGFALVLNQLGFLPTAAIFLVVGIKYLGRRSWAFTLASALGSLALIWIVFRLVFSVLMPEGIVPEGEIIQGFRNLVAGGAQ